MVHTFSYHNDLIHCDTIATRQAKLTMSELIASNSTYEGRNSDETKLYNRFILNYLLLIRSEIF